MKPSLFTTFIMTLALGTLVSCGKSGGGGSSGSSSNNVVGTSVLNPSYTAAQNLALVQNKLLAKNVGTGVTAGYRYVFSNTSNSVSSVFGGLFNMTSNGSTKCDNVYVQAIGSDLKSLTVAATYPIGCTRLVTADDYSAFTAGSYFQVNNPGDAHLSAFLALTNATSVTTTYYSGYLAYSIIVSDLSGTTQYVIAPDLPLLANPIQKCTQNSSGTSCRTLSGVKAGPYNL